MAVFLTGQAKSAFMNAIKKYIYGVIPRLRSGQVNSDGEKSFGTGGEVYTISHQDIACVVSDTNMDSFNSMPKETLGRRLVEHQATIEKIMKDYTIIPFKFGTIVEEEMEVKRVLQSGYGEFKEKLQIIDKKIELDVVALWNDLNGVIKKLGEENNQIKAFKDQIAKRPPEETLQDRIKIGSMVKDALDEKRGVLQSEMLDFLKEKAADFQKHELMDDKMILNCAFLLDKNKEKGFEQALNELDARFNEEINFKCVGPLPPYSFSTIELKKVGYAEINQARQLLGLNEEVTLSEIKESYRQLALKFHPDSNSNDPSLKKRFEEIVRAYKLLTNYCQQVSQSEKCSFSAVGGSPAGGWSASGGTSGGRRAKGKDFILIDILKI